MKIGFRLEDPRGLMAKITTLQEAVAELVCDGDSVA